MTDDQLLAFRDAIARHLARSAPSTEDPLTEACCNDMFPTRWLTDEEFAAAIEAEAKDATRLPDGFAIAAVFVVAAVSAISLVMRYMP